MTDPAYRGEPRPGDVPPAGPPAQPRPNGTAIAALVTGIIALVLSWLPGINLISIVLGIVAIVTGVLGMRAAKDPATGGRGMAIAGLVTGVLGLLVAVLIWIGLFAIASDPELQQELEQDLEQLEQEQQDG